MDFAKAVLFKISGVIYAYLKLFTTISYLSNKIINSY